MSVDGTENDATIAQVLGEEFELVKIFLIFLLI